MIYDNINEVTEELLESLFDRYQIGLVTSVRDNHFIFACVHFYIKWNVIKIS